MYGSSGSAPRRPVSSTGREAQQRRAPSPTVNSRGPSPGRSGPSSRAPSPRIPQSSNSRAPRPSAGSHRASAGSAGSAGSRPASAGRTGRFDPTAYVQQKKEEQRQKQLDRSRRTFSPGGSRHSSGSYALRFPSLLHALPVLWNLPVL